MFRGIKKAAHDRRRGGDGMDNIIIYNTDDGKTNVKLYANDGTVWLTQAQMAELFQTTKQNIS